MSESFTTEIAADQETSALPREQFWREHVSRWRQSGLSQSGYCRREGLKLHQLTYWRKKVDRSESEVTSGSMSGFVPVRVLPPSVDERLSVTLPNGSVLCGISSANVELVGQLISKL